jgi:hypothetical protein
MVKMVLFIKRIISMDETDVNWTNAPFTTDNNQILPIRLNLTKTQAELMSLD